MRLIMSEERTQADVEAIKAGLAEAKRLEDLKSETANKKALIDARRVTTEYERQEQDIKDLAAMESASYGELSEDQIAELQADHSDYIKAAKDSLQFINPEFDQIVPFFRKNIILLCAKSGDGKSTAVANIAYSVMKQTNPNTGKPRKTLVLSNEENPADVYARVVCLGKNWAYTNHRNFSQEQSDTFNKGIRALSKGAKLTVIGDTHNGIPGTTTSPEGIKGVLDNLIKNKEWYDTIVIDYYQNVIFSKENPKMTEYEAQAKLCRILDQYKNVYPGAIVVMAQMDPPTENNPKPYQHRIQGRKLIVTQSTLIMEMSADRDLRATKWTVHKSRFTEAVGQSFLTGYDNGKYVEFNDEFQSKVQKWKDARDDRALNKQLGQELKEKMNEEDENVPD
jgi:hypothetical protein